MKRLDRLNGRGCAFVGCVHLHALCGSPEWRGDLQTVRRTAMRDAGLYAAGGVDGLLVENTHDTPYQRSTVDAGTIAGMAVVAAELREAYPKLPIGIQVLAGADIAALDIAATCDLDFVRAEGFVYAHVADEGIIQGDAANILRRRAHLGADHVEVWTDIKKKHCANAITGDLSVREQAMGAVYCRADGVIITGVQTGDAPVVEDVESVTGLGVRAIVGSGVDVSNVADLGRIADVLLVGSACKKKGDWRNGVDRRRVERLVEALRGA